MKQCTTLHPTVDAGSIVDWCCPPHQHSFSPQFAVLRNSLPFSPHWSGAVQPNWSGAVQPNWSGTVQPNWSGGDVPRATRLCTAARASYRCGIRIVAELKVLQFVR